MKHPRVWIYGVLAVSIFLFCFMVFYLFAPDVPPSSKWNMARNEMVEMTKAIHAYAREQDGKYPDTLNVLKEKYFPNGVPKDRFTKEEYDYERTATGFMLTCLGKDQQPGGAEIPDRDLVFTEAGQQ